MNLHHGFNIGRSWHYTDISSQKTIRSKYSKIGNNLEFFYFETDDFYIAELNWLWLCLLWNLICTLELFRLPIQHTHTHTLRTLGWCWPFIMCALNSRVWMSAHKDAIRTCLWGGSQIKHNVIFVHVHASEFKWRTTVSVWYGQALFSCVHFFQLVLFQKKKKVRDTQWTLHSFKHFETEMSKLYYFRWRRTL